MAETKLCRRCGHEKSLAKFYLDKRSGRPRSPCRECIRVRENEYRRRVYYTPQFQASKRASRERCREAHKRYNLEWVAQNRDKVNARQRRWAKANPEMRKAIRDTWRAKRRSQEAGGLTSAQLRQWLQDQKKVCHWCGARCVGKYDVDHIIPLSKGGKHEARNLCIACRTCNRRKHAKDPIDFARELGKLL
jgi:5-methylcytosine-specific restriction endonuclease McrA